MYYSLEWIFFHRNRINLHVVVHSRKIVQSSFCTPLIKPHSIFFIRPTE